MTADATRERLSGVRRCDVAIVGAGLTGLSTALAIRERDPDRRIVVVEADRVGAGASGRGTGLLGTRIGPRLAVARKRFGDPTARSAYLWSVAAVGHVMDLVERHRISCDLVPGTQLIAARDAKGALAQRAEADAARALGLDISYVDRTELPDVARAAGYVSGLRYAPAATLDPAALTNALARIAEREGVVIFEGSPVRTMSGGRKLILSGADGQVVADNVVVAVNGFDGVPGSPEGVVGLRVQAGLTGKLSPAVARELAGLRTEPLIGADEASPYFRLTVDDRIVVGGGAVRRGTADPTAPAPHVLKAAVRSLHPALSDVDMEMAWSGPIGMTRDGLPVVGRDPRDPRVYYAGGCNGHGLAVTVSNGVQLARWLVDRRADLRMPPLPWIRPKAPWIPQGRLVEFGLDRYLAHLTAKYEPTRVGDGVSA